MLRTLTFFSEREKIPFDIVPSGSGKPTTLPSPKLMLRPASLKGKMLSRGGWIVFQNPN